MKTTLLLAAGALALVGCGEAGAGDANPAASGRATAAIAAPAGTDWTTTVAQTPEGGMRMGNPNAPVKLVEFASMTCHVCRDFAKDSTPALEDKYVKTGQVSYEFRNFLRDPIDVAASLLARCGGPQPFFKLTEQMFAEQDALLKRAQSISPADAKSLEGLPPSRQMTRMAQLTELDRFVGMRGVPAARAQACLSNEAELNKLVAMTQAASKQYNITGTPTFLINGEVVENATSWNAIEPKIRAALGA